MYDIEVRSALNEIVFFDELNVQDVSVRVCF